MKRSLAAGIWVRAILLPVLSGLLAAAAGADDGLDALLEAERSASETAESRSAEPRAAETDAGESATPRATQAAPVEVRRRLIEEIIVTAQKTKQEIRDVPISMSVLSAEFMDQENVTDLQDLSRYVPNTNINPHGVYPDFRIRGFGSDPVNKAFEQSVGMAIDGIPYGRQQYFQGALFDVERVEVLRGPQGILFGKNTTAGLFSVTTKDPSEDFSGFVDLELGELARRRAEAAIGGPLIASFLSFRLSGISEERDGFVRNTTAKVVPGLDPRMGGRDRKALRFKLGFADLFGANVVVGYERSDVDLQGNATELRIVPQNMRMFYRRWDPNADFDPKNWVGSLDLPGFSSMDADTVTVNGSYDLGGWGVEAVAGHSSLEFAGAVDIDSSPAPLVSVDPNKDDNRQTTFELRIKSPRLLGLFGLERLFDFALGSTELTAGLFYQRRRIDSVQSTRLNLPVVAEAAAFQNLSPEGGEVPPLEEFIGLDVPIGALGRFDTTQGEEVNTLFFDQTLNAVAGFGQMDWHCAERWTLQYGMRLGHERKAAGWKRMTEEGTGLVLGAFAGFEDFTASFSRSEYPSFTPKVAVQHDWSDDINLYASWAKGFKAGGFNEMPARGNREELVYDAEKATAWELGAKSHLLGGAARVNLAVFQQAVTDLQVLATDPGSILVRTRNVGEARARGIELDGTWLAASWLTIVGALGFNDAKFLDFPLGPCARDRENTDGDENPQCDLSGRGMFRTPRWTGMVTPAFRFPLAAISAFGLRSPLERSGIDWVGSLSMEYKDVQYVAESLDPRTRQPSFIRLNATVGLEDTSRGWSLGFTGQNLTNQLTTFRISDPPLTTGVFWQSPDTPRLFFGSFRWGF